MIACTSPVQVCRLPGERRNPLAAPTGRSEVEDLWSPYLTMAEGIKIAAEYYKTDVSKLSCCAS